MSKRFWPYTRSAKHSLPHNSANDVRWIHLDFSTKFLILLEKRKHHTRVIHTHTNFFIFSQNAHENRHHFNGIDKQWLSIRMKYIITMANIDVQTAFNTTEDERKKNYYQTSMFVCVCFLFVLQIKWMRWNRRASHRPDDQWPNYCTRIQCKIS